MKIPFLPLWCAVLLAGAAGAALAEKADRNKPMNIEADSLRYDDLKQVSVFSGRVVLTKGTIQIRGAQIEVRQDPDGFQFGVVTGTPQSLAFFRQKREGLDEFIEGEGETIEYDGKADTVKFIRKAHLRRLRGATLADEITGGVIVYENLTDMFTVDGNASKAATGVVGAPAGRVRAMLTPKPETNGAAAPVVPAATLRPSTTLGGAAQ
ncbi:MAG TPA: lipopolysaccharide transport periplasmic protein LptA [Rhodoferax sp.]|nr:lipopolysaccharide transport periplasmic protein LptA [Rhodoferax sp.]